MGRPCALAQERPEILPLARVAAGMKGYGLTVMSGGKIDRFDVEVLDVLKNAAPGRSAILVELSGLGLEETGIPAGMSGSPVYLEGKLAGAVSAAWGFSKKPIGIATPIESMLQIETEQPPTGARPAGRTSLARVAALLSGLGEAPEGERVERLREELARFLPPAPGATLLSPLATGIPPETFARFRDPLARLGLPDAALVAGGPPGAPATGPAEPLRPGSSITAYLVDGDVQLGATGTVTDVSPDGRFLAFGHPFLNLGSLELPVASSRISAVLPSLFQSFKLGNASRPAFRITRDRDAGVSGRTDGPAPLVPVRLRFEGEGGAARTFTFGVVPHPRLLPLLLTLASDAALTICDPASRDQTVRFAASFSTAAGTIAYEDEAAGPRARELALLTNATLAGAIADNDFEDPKLSGIELSFKTASGERRLKLAGAALASRRVAPGETVVAALRLTDRRGAETTRVVRLAVPRETPEGRATFLLADGSAASSVLLALDPVEPRTLGEFGRWVARLVPTDRIVAALLVPSRGAATRTGTLSALPPTAAALLSGGPDGSGSSRTDPGQRLLAREVLAFDRPVTGTVRLELEVEKPRL